MSTMEQDAGLARGHQTGGARARPCDPHHVDDLVQVLSQHPGGLRRWSVMRAMRKLHEEARREISLKFEDDIERVFRSLCADNDQTPARGPKKALFYRPRDKAGEVWAVIPERAKAWVAGAPQDID